MASRLKEDERNERTIRSLLKLPANKRCINCNSLGPQYVCTNFWTFVCTTCSGIHREFTHRVKSVSMAKFTSQEVAALQGGGNERAKSVYFKDWDSQRHSYPDSSNIDRLRDFIRHVYIDRRFSGEKISEKPPRGEDSYDNRRNDAFRGGSRSPPYEDTYDRRRNDRPSPGGRSDDSYSKYDDRSPGYDKESRYSSDHGRSPTRPEIVNDWRREDRFGNTRKPEDRRTSDGDSLSEGRSPDYQKDVNMPSPPVVRPVRDILGDNVIPLKIDPPKPNGIKAADAPVHVVRTASSSSFGSYDGNQVEPRRETLGSLIDFDADPEPPAVTASMPQTEQTSSVSMMIQPASSTSNDNWASFDFATEAKAPQTSSNTLDSLLTHQTSSNTLDSLLTQLTPPSVPVQSGQPQNASDPFFASGGESKPDLSMGQVPTAPFKAEGFTAASSGAGVAFNDVNASGSWPNMQPLSFPSGGPHPPSGQQPSNFSAAQLPQPVSNSAHEVANGFGTQPQKAETKSSGRSALPEDLFAATYHSPLTAPQGWHTNHPVGMGYAMHYNVRAPTHHFQQPSKSSNPFDFSNDSSAAPAPPFSSMASLHGALPTMPQPSTGLLQTSNIGAPPPAYMQHQMSSYTSQAPPYAGGMPSGAYFGQQVAQSIPAIRSQGVGGIADSSFFSSANPRQLMARGYVPPTTAPAAPNSFPSGGGNPFG